MVLLGDPTRALGALAEPECRRVLRRASRWPGKLRRAGRVVRGVRGRQDRDGLRHREHGLDLPGAARDHRVHPGRRRDQRRRHRHQRRRPAVLERRGDDAHAHQGHPGDDAGLGDGAHRQAVAGLLRRRLGRGQLRHRRLRPDHGPERAGAVLGARPVSAAVDVLLAHYAHTYRAPGERFPRPAPTTDPVDRDVSRLAARRAGRSSPRVGEIFDHATNPEPQEAVRHPLDAARGRRRRPPAAGALGGHGRRRGRGRATTRTWAGSRWRCWASSRGRCPGAGRCRWTGPTTFTAGTLFPRSSKKTARAINAASGNRPLVVLANLSGFDGSPESLRQLQLEYGAEIGRAVVNFDGPDRVLRGLPLPRRGVRGVLRRRSTRAWRSPRSRAPTRR